MPHGIHGLPALSSKRGGVVFTFWEAMLMMSAGVAAHASVLRRVAHGSVAAFNRGLRSSLGGDLRKPNVACAIIVVVTLGFAGRSNGSTTPQVSTTPSWGFPLKTGTQVTLGCLGLHDDNIFADGSYTLNNSKPVGATSDQLEALRHCPPPEVDEAMDPTHASEASLDLLTAAAGVPVIPLAAGKVLVADEACHFVLVDHSTVSHGVWVAYLHLDLDARVHTGLLVTRDTLLGTTAAPHTSSCEHSDAPHVHLAFLSQDPADSSGHTGVYSSMVGKELCGYRVLKDPSNSSEAIGALQELANPNHIVSPGQSLTVPDCPSSPTSHVPTATAQRTLHGTITEFAIPLDDKSPQYGSSPTDITTGPDGALWFTEANGNKIGRITTTGAITEFTPPAATGGTGPGTITAGPDGALWFAGDSHDRIVRVTTTGTMTEFPVDGGPADIITGPDGALWFTLPYSNQIGRMTTTGNVTKFSLPEGNAFTGLGGITVGSDGALWFTEFARPDVEGPGNKIGRITTEGTVTEFPIPTTDSFPGDIIAGLDGALWFTEYRGDKIGRITTAGNITEFPLQSRSGPAGITAGPDGAIWFTEGGGNKIGRITTTGVITEFPLPKPVPTSRYGSGTGREPEGITVGPDGALWFTEFVGDNIGRLT